MKIWLDTTNIETVKKADHLGLLYGVTTNPNLIAELKRPMRQVLQELLDHQDGPVTAQVVADHAQEMIEQGEKLYDFSDRMIVKVPVTQAGLEAIQALKQLSIPTMATVILQPYQVLLAGIAGADYVAPYLGQIERNGQDPWQSLIEMFQIIQNYQFKTEILAASIGSLEQFSKCAVLGISNVTIKDALFTQLIAADPKTQERINQFNTNWKEAKLSFL
jgi:transaldolase